MSNYSRGADAERRIRDRFERRGWTAIRSAGSKGPADLVIGKAGRTILVEVKANKSGGPFGSFPPAQRQRMQTAAHVAGWECLLVWVPPDGRGPRFVPDWGWPP